MTLKNFCLFRTFFDRRCLILVHGKGVKILIFEDSSIPINMNGKLYALSILHGSRFKLFEGWPRADLRGVPSDLAIWILISLPHP